MRTYEIKITGSGTLNQITVRLQEILRELQITEVYGGEVERETEDETLMCEVTEEYHSALMEAYYQKFDMPQ